MLFLLYTADVTNIAQRHGIGAHSYADDTQLSKAVSCASSISRMATCIEEINQWMTSNCLKLKSDKTQFIWLGTRQQLAKIHCQTITLRGTSIHISTEVTCLGEVFTSGVSPGDVSTNLGSFAQSDVHSTLMQRRHLLMHSSQVVLIIAIVFSVALVQSIFVNPVCSKCVRTSYC